MKFADWLERGYDTLISIAPPGADIADAGKCPARYDASRGTWYAPKGWNTYDVAPSDLDAWEKWGANLGLVNRGQFFILDIDAYDEARAASIEKTAKAVFGEAPRRVGQWPKRTLLYRAAEPIPGRNISYAEGDRTDQVQILGKGKQTVVQGIHPKTKEPFQWDRDLPRFEDLSAVTVAQVEDFIGRLERNLPKAQVSSRAGDGPAKDPEALKGDHDLVRDAVMRIPNTDLDYEDYIDVGQAVRGAFGPGFEDEAYEVWDEWARKSPKYDETLNEKHWRTMHQSRTLGAQYIYERAAKHGWDRVAEAYFKPYLPDPLDDMFASQEPERPRNRFELLTDEQLQNMPDPRWLIGRHLPEDGIGILYGRPNTGKSFVILDMALTIATGKSHWHGDEVAPGAGGVLYIAGEGSADLKLRVRAWKKQNWFENEILPPNRFRVLVQPMNFMRKEDILDLLAAVESADMGRLSLIVVDTVSRAAAGADENSQQDMSIFVQALDALRVKTGAFVEGIHHESKGGMMRGSTVLSGAADVIHHFERKEHQPYGRLTCVKMKAGPDDARDSYRLDKIDLGNELSSLVPVRVEEHEAEAAICTEQTKEEIFAAIMRDAAARNHWSTAAQSRSAGRKFAAHEIASGWGVGEDVAEQWLDMWMTGQEPELQMVMVDARMKRRGLIVVDRPIMDSVFD